MKKLKKRCAFCKEDFYPKRIDSRYCSASCRARGNRSNDRKDLYEQYAQISFYISHDEFNTLCDKAMKDHMTPNELAKLFCTTQIDVIKLYNL